MIPIHRDTGAIVAFGGRAMEEGQQPKYLNSPETPIYVKGRTLYGLNWSKPSISRLRYAVIVEGYFDWAQALQGGHHQRRGLVGHGVDARTGASAETICCEKSSSASIRMRPDRGRRRGRRS